MLPFPEDPDPDGTAGRFRWPAFGVPIFRLAARAAMRRRKLPDLASIVPAPDHRGGQFRLRDADADASPGRRHRPQAVPNDRPSGALPTAVALALIVGLAGVLLTAASWLRGAEYDEQYTLFLTAGVARPVWPSQPFPAGTVTALQAGHSTLVRIAQDLRATDVHPPLYFWLVSLWRQVAGPSLFAARLLSVLLSLVSLAAVARIARAIGVPPVPAMLLTLGCYGFAYTGAIARGFALAQALTLCGTALLIHAARDRRAAPALLAGLLLGAAPAANYLAGFAAGAGLVWLAWRRWRAPRVWLAAWLGASLWLPLLLWFFLAQRGSRDGQFPAFSLLPGVARLARYTVASVFGGLPLYLQGAAGLVTAISIAGLFAWVMRLIAWRWRRLGRPDTRTLLALGAVAPAVGLLTLGLIFNTTPIELRYLAFAAPFLGLLMAGALHRRERALVLAVQSLALAGMLTRPETMQPARSAARAAAALAGDGAVLLPHGNDGVGIVGAFAIEARPATSLLLVEPNETPDIIRARAAPFARVTLALLGQDGASRATLPALLAAFDRAACWRPAGGAGFVLAFERRDACADGPVAAAPREGAANVDPRPGETPARRPPGSTER